MNNFNSLKKIFSFDFPMLSEEKVKQIFPKTKKIRDKVLAFEIEIEETVLLVLINLTLLEVNFYGAKISPEVMSLATVYEYLLGN